MFSSELWGGFLVFALCTVLVQGKEKNVQLNFSFESEDIAVFDGENVPVEFQCTGGNEKRSLQIGSADAFVSLQSTDGNNADGIVIESLEVSIERMNAEESVVEVPEDKVAHPSVVNRNSNDKNVVQQGGNEIKGDSNEIVAFKGQPVEVKRRSDERQHDSNDAEPRADAPKDSDSLVQDLKALQQKQKQKEQGTHDGGNEPNANAKKDKLTDLQKHFLEVAMPDISDDNQHHSRNDTSGGANDRPVPNNTTPAVAPGLTEPAIVEPAAKPDVAPPLVEPVPAVQAPTTPVRVDPAAPVAPAESAAPANPEGPFAPAEPVKRAEPAPPAPPADAAAPAAPADAAAPAAPADAATPAAPAAPADAAAPVPPADAAAPVAAAESANPEVVHAAAVPLPAVAENIIEEVRRDEGVLPELADPEVFEDPKVLGKPKYSVDERIEMEFDDSNGNKELKHNELNAREEGGAVQVDKPPAGRRRLSSAGHGSDPGWAYTSYLRRMLLDDHEPNRTVSPVCMANLEHMRKDSKLLATDASIDVYQNSKDDLLDGISFVCKQTGMILLHFHVKLSSAKSACFALIMDCAATWGKFAVVEKSTGHPVFENDRVVDAWPVVENSVASASTNDSLAEAFEVQFLVKNNIAVSAKNAGGRTGLSCVEFDESPFNAQLIDLDDDDALVVDGSHSFSAMYQCVSHDGLSSAAPTAAVSMVLINESPIVPHVHISWTPKCAAPSSDKLPPELSVTIQSCTAPNGVDAVVEVALPQTVYSGGTLGDHFTKDAVDPYRVAEHDGCSKISISSVQGQTTVELTKKPMLQYNKDLMWLGDKAVYVENQEHSAEVFVRYTCLDTGDAAMAVTLSFVGGARLDFHWIKGCVKPTFRYGRAFTARSGLLLVSFIVLACGLICFFTPIASKSMELVGRKSPDSFVNPEEQVNLVGVAR